MQRRNELVASGVVDGAPAAAVVVVVADDVFICYFSAPVLHVYNIDFFTLLRYDSRQGILFFDILRVMFCCEVG